MTISRDQQAAAAEEVSELPTEVGIARIQDFLMTLLRELDATAEASGVSYFLAYGTAIGALRHRGFIPWDVDADVFIWGHEYEQVIAALRAHLPEDVTLHAPEDGSGYEYLFPRLGVRGIDHTLVHLDLFPLQPAPAAGWQQRVHRAGTWLCCQLYLVKQMPIGSRTHYGTVKRLVTRIGKVVLRPVPSWVLHRAFTAFTNWFAARSTGEVVASTCSHDGPREFFARSWFDTAVPARFRDADLRIPSGCREMLEWFYGDFMTPVPDPVREREVQLIEDHFLGPLRARGIL